jgi:hypothetical protein
MKAYMNGFFRQIASAVVDAPYSGFLVAQDIDESFTVLQYETERGTLAAGTYPLSMPSGLASNKQSVFFISANVDSTLTLVSRDYGNLNDETLVCDIRANEPFYAVLHNIKSASITLAGTTSIQSFVAKVSPVSATSSSSPNQGLDPGSIPVGGIIAVSGTFANTAPPSGYSEAGILPFPSYLHPCDGTLITDSESIFFGKYAPNIVGNKTLFGSNTAGTETQSSTSATLLTGFGTDWNIYQAVDVAAAYTVKYFIRIK